MRRQIAERRDRLGVAAQDETPEQRRHGHGQEENGPPPDAGRKLALRLRREDLEDVDARP